MVPTRRPAPILLVLSSALFACAATSDPASWNPEYFSFKIKDGVMTGTYNPLGFDEDIVRTQVAHSCRSKVLKTFDASEVGELIAFSATCSGRTVHRGGQTEVQRNADGKIVSDGLYY